MLPPLPPGNGTDKGMVIGALGIEIGAANDLVMAAKLGCGPVARPCKPHSNILLAAPETRLSRSICSLLGIWLHDLQGAKRVREKSIRGAVDG
jgi:hypothetical protein